MLLRGIRPGFTMRSSRLHRLPYALKKETVPSCETLHSNRCVIFQLLAQLEYADYQRAVWEVLNKVRREQVPEGQIWRQIQFLSVIGPAALPPELLDRVRLPATALR